MLDVHLFSVLTNDIGIFDFASLHIQLNNTKIHGKVSGMLVHIYTIDYFRIGSLLEV